MSRPPPRSTRTDTLFPYTTLFRSLDRLARSKAYLFAGVEIRWKCAPELIADETPAEAVFQFPGGLADHLKEQVGDRECATSAFFSGSQDFPDAAGRRSGERRVGKASVSTCSSRWVPLHKKKKTKAN